MFVSPRPSSNTSTSRRRFPIRLSLLLVVCAIAFALATAGVLAQKSRKISGGSNKTTTGKSKTTSSVKMQDVAIGETVGAPWIGERGIERTTAEIMQAQQLAPPSSRPHRAPEREVPGREDRPQDPNARPVASFPELPAGSTQGSHAVSAAPTAPQTVSTPNFLGATLADTGAFPPDTMGAVGPTQFVVHVNGRVRTFNKTTGVADGVINADTDVFFASIMSPFPVGGLNFTSDPNVRYDRLTKRWFLTIIDVPSTSPASIGDIPNRVLIAVSDAASNGVLSGGTVWTFYFIQQNTVGGIPSTGEFLDYPSLGVDNNALYIGGNMFGAVSGSFIGCSVFVVQKTSVLSGGPIVTTAFRGVVVGASDGPFAPRGVDNYDAAATEGYFIGISNAAFGRVNMRRIANPGGVPTISADIPISVTSTVFPENVPHLGNTGGTSGRLDALDDRLFAAHIRNGRLWTAHNIEVNATGTASTTGSRDAARWYELNVPVGAGTPTVVQSGTVFDPAVTNPQYYWIPSVMVSGQGHAALGFSVAGNNDRANAGTNGRLRTDTLGTTQAVALYTASSTAYNPPADPGPPRRWGDYSFTSLDPNDDMTMWTIQEYCNATNSYGVQIVKLLAPPPATPTTAVPATVPQGNPSQNVVITGTSVAGTEFYDPGAGFANRISATVTGGVTVNSVTYTDPTHVTLNISTVAASAGPQTVTITNPDGQNAAGAGILIVTAPATYTWNQTGTAAWTTATNWTPARITPAVDDILVFNNGATTTATGVPAETIGQLLISGNTNVTLQAGGTNTLTIAGFSGADLSVAAGSQLNVNTATALTINVATGATGSISGAMTLSAGAHRLTAVDASGITFNSGGMFTEGAAFSGNPFGTTNLNSVVFANGSTFIFIAGSNPFGAAQPNSVVVFQTGSLYRHQSSGTPGASGRTYANFELNIAATTITITGGSALVVNDLTITAGTLNFNMTGTPGHSIKGNVSIVSGQTLNFNPATPGTVNFNGSAAQTIGGAGTLTLAANQTVNINNALGVSLLKDATLNGTLTLTNGDLNTGANTLTMPAAATSGPATNATDVVGNVKRTGFVSGGAALSFGNPNNQIQVNTGTAPTDINVNLLKASPVDFGNAIRRTYTITVNGGSSLNGTVRFHYRNSEVNGNAENTLTAWRNDAGVWNNQGKSSNFDDTVGEDNWVQRDNVTTFSPWTLASGMPTAARSSISGRISAADGSALAGVVMRLSGNSSASTITDRNGNYRFDGTKTGSFYTVTPELANYHFSPDDRSFSLVGDKTDAVFTASSDAVITANAIDTAEYFVRQHYLDFLGREPEAGGFNYWSDQANQCHGDDDCVRTRRIDISAAFFMSREFQDTGSFVYRLYRGTLGRQLRYSEFSADRAQVIGGPNLEASKTAFANAFVQRAEFADKYQANNTAASFVDALLQTVNESATSVDLSNERAALIERYNAGGNMAESRALVVRELVDSASFRSAVYNESFVAMEYFGYLRRNPDARGYQFWLNALNSTGDHRGMVCSFITSAEYQRRFSSVVTHSNAECGQ